MIVHWTVVQRLRTSYVVGWIGRWWLALWFGAVTLARLSALRPGEVLLDARVYLAASRAWLAGSDPWRVVVDGLPFAAPPPTLLATAPFALLPPAVDVAALGVTVVVAAIVTLRMLRLPWWWLAFPPLAECMMSGQVQAFLLPLILGGWGGIAVLVKAYAVIPLIVLGQWRQLALAAAATALTVPILPWSTFVADLGMITAASSDYSRAGVGTPLLIVLSPLWLAALLVVGRESAAWFGIAVWPTPQPYYSTLMMPRARGLVAAVIAAPFPGAPLAGLLVAGAVRMAARLRARGPAGRGVSARAPGGPGAAG